MPRKEREGWLLLSFPLFLLLFQFMEVYIAQGVCTPFSSCFFFFFLPSIFLLSKCFSQAQCSYKGSTLVGVIFFFFYLKRPLKVKMTNSNSGGLEDSVFMVSQNNNLETTRVGFSSLRPT